MSGSLNLAEILGFLLDAPMFGDLDEAELSYVVHRMQIVHLRPEQTLFREGEAGDGWYVVYRGQLRVEVSGRQVAQVALGSCVGEMSVLDGSRRSATVVADEDTVLLRFSREVFEELRVANDPVILKLVYHMAKTLAARQRVTTKQLGEVLAGKHVAARTEALVGPIFGASTTAE